jgi:hypothetical protein
MKKILEGPSRRVGSIFQEVDTNFIEVCNCLLRIAFPECTLKGYAEKEPAEPALFDCYLVKEDATLWEIAVEKDQVLSWDGADWLVVPFKITEINQALQFLYFDADKIAILPIEGIYATNVQQVLEQFAQALISLGFVFPSTGSTSGSI